MSSYFPFLSLSLNDDLDGLEEQVTHTGGGDDPVEFLNENEQIEAASLLEKTFKENNIPLEEAACILDSLYTKKIEMEQGLTQKGGKHKHCDKCGCALIRGGLRGKLRGGAGGASSTWTELFHLSVSHVCAVPSYLLKKTYTNTKYLLGWVAGKVAVKLCQLLSIIIASLAAIKGIPFVVSWLFQYVIPFAAKTILSLASMHIVFVLLTILIVYLFTKIPVPWYDSDSVPKITKLGIAKTALSGLGTAAGFVANNFICDEIGEWFNNLFKEPSDLADVEKLKEAMGLNDEDVKEILKKEFVASQNASVVPVAAPVVAPLVPPPLVQDAPNRPILQQLAERSARCYTTHPYLCADNTKHKKWCIEEPENCNMPLNLISTKPKRKNPKTN